MDNYGGDFEKNEEVLSQLTLLNTIIHNSLGGNGYTVTLSLDKWYVFQRGVFRTLSDIKDGAFWENG